MEIIKRLVACTVLKGTVASGVTEIVCGMVHTVLKKVISILIIKCKVLHRVIVVTDALL